MTGRRRQALPALTALLLALLPGCVPALRPPPSLAILAGTPRPAGAVTGDMRNEAAALHRQRQPDAALAAASLALHAADLDAEDPAPLLLAAEILCWLATYAPAADARQAAATRAVQTAQWCASRFAGQPVCDYWLGAALGVQARERRATGLSALPLIQAALSRAASARPDYLDGGPDRGLALVYLRAPGWPKGPGDAQLGLDHALRALKHGPDFPPNLMALAEALQKTGSRPEADTAWERARTAAISAAGDGHPDAPAWLAEIQAAQPRAAQPLDVE